MVPPHVESHAASPFSQSISVGRPNGHEQEVCRGKEDTVQDYCWGGPLGFYEKQRDRFTT